MRKKRRTCVIDRRLRVESRILRHWYDIFNHNYFSNKLPKNVFLFWDGDMYENGYGRFYRTLEGGRWQYFPAISIFSNLRVGNIFASTLLHEMIHASGKLSHNNNFDRERKRLLRYRHIRDIIL